jgi:succinoglycan biosynthesis transport protein ExoP
MELRQYLLMAWKWIWMIGAATLLAAGASYIATSQQPKLYQSTTKLMVGLSIQSINPNPQDIQTSGQLAATYVQIAKTKPVMMGTIDALGLNMNPDTLGEQIGASVVPGTQLIELRVSDVDPMRAQALTNELAHQLTLRGPAGENNSPQREFTQRQVDELQKKIQDGQQAIADLQKSIQVTLSAREIAAKQQQIATLENQINQWQASYSTMLALLAIRSPNSLSIVEVAELPSRPFSPNVALSTLLAAAVGLVLSLGAAVLIEYMDDTLKSPDDVLQTLELPTLSVLCNLKKAGSENWLIKLRRIAEGNRHPSRFPVSVSSNPESTRTSARHSSGMSQTIVTAVLPRSPDAEAYRILRTGIQFGGIERSLKSILVTSSNRGEGKSLTAANLAVVMAQAGLRTILVDADMRKPCQHHLFGLENKVGLSTMLLGSSEADIAIRATPVQNLRILTSGVLPPNPAELLSSERMRALKAQLTSETDILIVDCPPCLPVTDAVILGRWVDGVVFVIDVSHTQRKAAIRAKQLLTKSGAHIIGVVLNRVIPSQSDYYYYHGYSSSPEETETQGETKAPKESSRWGFLSALIRRQS